MSTELPYADNLVRVTADTIRFAWYYFPLGSKTVQLSEIDRIVVLPNRLETGAFRLWGSGDLRTWFPLDWQRPSRKNTYFLHRRGRRVVIGFTVDDEDAFQAALGKCGIDLTPGSLDHAAEQHRKWLFIVAMAMLLVLGMLGTWGGLPLIAGRVPPNSSYGVRTAATLADAHLWYRANYFCGWALEIVGACSTLLGLLIFAKRKTWPQWVPVGAMVLAPLAFVTAMVANLVYVEAIR